MTTDKALPLSHLHSTGYYAIVFTVLLSLVLYIPHATKAQQRGKRYTFHIVNHSRFRIDRIYVTHTYETDWGQDLLGSVYLKPNQYYDITAPAGEYDVKLVDEDGDKCIVNEILISQDFSWEITNTWLKQCEGRTTQ
jgi:hypothetical protein